MICTKKGKEFWGACSIFHLHLKFKWVIVWLSKKNYLGKKIFVR